jgi:hypothetical protein
MALSAKPQPRILAILGLPKHKTPLYISRARFIVASVRQSSWFPKPSPPLKDVEAAMDDLVSAQTTAMSGLKGGATVRDEKRLALHTLLQELQGHVQAVADANLEHAPEIIESAGMSVKKRRTVVARTFAAQSDGSGKVRVTVPSAGDRAAYEFEYSLDGGATWLQLQYTTKTTVTKAGLVPGSTVHFRVRAVVKGVMGNWSDPISIIVG